LSTRWNKDCVMWHVWQWLFWETIIVSHVCCYSVNHSNGNKCTLNYCVNGSIWHFKFPKVVQAHTLGEVGILGTVLFRVSSGTILTIFIEIGSYLTEKEQKISCHSFFRHGVFDSIWNFKYLHSTTLMSGLYLHRCRQCILWERWTKLSCLVKANWRSCVNTYVVIMTSRRSSSGLICSPPFSCQHCSISGASLSMIGKEHLLGFCRLLQYPYYF